jgi:hypothetical protein
VESDSIALTHLCTEFPNCWHSFTVTHIIQLHTTATCKVFYRCRLKGLHLTQIYFCVKNFIYIRLHVLVYSLRPCWGCHRKALHTLICPEGEIMEDPYMNFGRIYQLFGNCMFMQFNFFDKLRNLGMNFFLSWRLWIRAAWYNYKNNQQDATM